MRRPLARLALCVLFLPAMARASATPNIVVLLADDMGYGDLAVQNFESKIPTPHLDQLAREGMRFTDAHSSSGICAPSRYALMTGRYHWRKLHEEPKSFAPPLLDPGELTLAEMLRAKGYRTAAIGKWDLGWGWDSIKKPDAEPKPVGKRKKMAYAPSDFDWKKPIPGGPLTHGFDEYFGDDVPNMPPYTWIENDRVLTEPTEVLAEIPPSAEGRWEPRPGPMVAGWRFDAVTPRLIEKAVEWIGKQKGSGKPFFLYLAFTSPHAPILPAPEFQGKSKAGAYGDFVVETDWAAGQVLRALDENGFRDDTLVLFSSDNGPENYAYERVRRFQHRSMGPLRGVKRDLFEGGHRIPFLVRWPGVVQAGRVSDDLMSQIDLMATIAAIVGYELPATAAEDSHDQLPLLRGQAAGSRTSLVHNTREDAYAIRKGTLVLIDAKSGYHAKAPAWFEEENGYAPSSEPAALYDLSQDLAQRKNLYADRRDQVAELRALLAKTRQAGEVRSGQASPAPAPSSDRATERTSSVDAPGEDR